ncbi:MAG: hypothetical protein WA775_05340 [Psychroserpens sp.]|uniref:hypothetical protein n=1 Tax=Psychroserpens sp. TaxID=2020870 RepID=UPI003C89CF5C
MKLILCMLFMLISAKECDENKTEVSENTLSGVEANAQQQMLSENETITYQATTRGFFLKIWIEGDLIMVSNDYSLKTVETYAFPSEEKEAFLNLIDTVDATSLPEVDVKSTSFQTDVAPMAFLQISEGKNIYKSKPFDHGNPPEAISAMVEKILSIKTLVENQ